VTTSAEIVSDSRFKRSHQLLSKSWSVANQVDSEEVRDRVRLAFHGLERVDADPALAEMRLREVRRHLSVGNDRSTTDDVRVPVRNAIQLIDGLLDETPVESSRAVVEEGSR